MPNLIIDRRNVSLDYATNCLIVRIENEAPRTLPLSRIKQLICLHNVQLSTQLIGQIHQRGIDFIVINQRHVEGCFSLFADQQKQVEFRCKQYQWQNNDTLRFHLAKALCLHKFNITHRTITPLAPNHSLPTRISAAINRLNSCHNDSTLRGIEGALQRDVFLFWREQTPPELGFTSRQRRPPPDPVNATLSYAYSFAHNEAVRQCKRTGLDSQLGFYHRTVAGRHSLACDLMEPLRPVIEQWVFALFSQKLLKRSHFSQSRGTALLNKEGRQQFYQSFNDIQPEWQKHLSAYARWIQNKLKDDNSWTVPTGISLPTI